jgi:ATP-dependent DNA ligase
VFLFAFGLLELDGVDLRPEPLETRKATLASVVRRAGAGVQLNEHVEHEDGEVVFSTLPAPSRLRALRSLVPLP